MVGSLSDAVPSDLIWFGCVAVAQYAHICRTLPFLKVLLWKLCYKKFIAEFQSSSFCHVSVSYSVSFKEM